MKPIPNAFVNLNIRSIIMIIVLINVFTPNYTCYCWLSYRCYCWCWTGYISINGIRCRADFTTSWQPNESQVQATSFYLDRRNKFIPASLRDTQNLKIEFYWSSRYLIEILCVHHPFIVALPWNRVVMCNVTEQLWLHPLFIQARTHGEDVGCQDVSQRWRWWALPRG